MEAGDGVGDEREDGVDLCIRCLHPVGYADCFCGKCGAPLDGVAATAAFLNIFAEGFIYRTAVAAPTRLITVVGVWIIFGTHMVVHFTMGMIGFGYGTPLTESHGVTTAMGSGAMTLIGFFAITQCTANYRRHREQEALDAALANRGGDGGDGGGS